MFGQRNDQREKSRVGWANDRGQFGCRRNAAHRFRSKTWAVEDLEARIVLSGQSPVALDDFYQVTTGQPFESQVSLGYTLSANQVRWEVADGGNGHVYENVSGPSNWSGARNAASQRMLGDTPGHLATITSAEEQAFLTSHFSDVRAWIGGYQDKTGLDYSEPLGGWRWVTGEPFDYANWNAGEPNNGGSEDFIETGGSHSWNDQGAGTFLTNYWVEYPVGPASFDQVFVSLESNWTYWDNGTAPGQGWTEDGFDDAAWSDGVGPLGYGQGDEGTVIGFGGDPQDRHITTYFRRDFQVNDPSLVDSLQLLLRRDDGAIVYLNGHEVVRSGVPVPSDGSTLAIEAVDDGGSLTSYDIDPSLLVGGVNVLSVEVHQASATSDDLSFDAALHAVTRGQGSVLANDTDPEGETLVANLVVGPTHGTLTLSPDGNFVYEPDGAFTGTDLFIYQTSDGTNLSAPAAVTIQVLAVNHVPVVSADSYSVVHDSTLNVAVGNGVLANDVDADANSLLAVLVTPPEHGTVVLYDDGSFEYNPSAGFVGTDSFEYVAGDGLGVSEVATATIQVTLTPESPIAGGDSYVVASGEKLVVDGPTGAPLVLLPGQFLWNELAGGNGHAYERVVADLSWWGASTAANARSLGGSDGHLITITSAAEQSFAQTFLRSGDRSAWTGGYQDISADDYIEPAGGWRWVTGEEFDYTNFKNGEPLLRGEEYLQVAANWGYEWNDMPGRVELPMYWVEYPLDAPIRNTVLIPKGAIWKYNDSGQDLGTVWRYPGYVDSSWSAGPGQLGYGDGDEQTIVSYGPDPFVKQITTYFRREFSIENPSQVERVELIVQRDDGIVVFLNGTEILRDGVIGELDFLSVSTVATDDGTEAYRFTVDPSLLVPGNNVLAAEVHQADANSDDITFDLALTATETALPGLLKNDVDPESDPMTAVLVAGPEHGTLALQADGRFEYTPDSGFVGTDQFTYRASDGVNSSSETMVLLQVEDSNQIPVASGDSYQAEMDGILTVSAAAGLLSNDSDGDADALTVELVTEPAHGSIEIEADGSFQYTPAAGYVGSDSFVYRVTDGTAYSAIASVSLTMSMTPEIPIARDDVYHVSEDGELIVDNSPRESIIHVPSGGQDMRYLAYDPVGDMLYVSLGNQNQIVPIDPDTGQRGEPMIVPGGPDKIVVTDDGKYMYVAADGSNAVIRIVLATKTIDLTIPLGTRDAEDLHIIPGHSESIAVAPSSSSGHITIYDDGVARPRAFGGSPNIEVNGDGTRLFGFSSFISSVDVGSLNIEADGLYFVAQKSYLVGRGNFEWAGGRLFFDSGHILDDTTLALQGTIIRPFNAEVVGLPGGERVAYVTDDANTIQVTDVVTQQRVGNVVVPGRPTARRGIPFREDGVAFLAAGSWDVYAVQSDAISGVSRRDLLANDMDPESQELSVILVQAPQHGVLDLNADGTFEYRPEGEYSGTDSFTYRVTDGRNLSDVATVTIHVDQVNDAPVAEDDSYVLADTSEPLEVSAADGLLANDADDDSAELSVRMVSGPQHGTLVLNADGSFRYTPNASFSLVDSFTYVTSDGNSESAAATVSLSLDVPRIQIGQIVLRPNTPNQQIPIYVHSGAEVSGINLFVQVGDGGPELSNYGVPAGTDGPAITGVDLKTGTIFAGVADSQVNQPGIPQVAVATLAISQGSQGVVADGLLATLTVDTTGFLGGTWDLALTDVLPYEALSGPFSTDFAGVPALITTGQIIIEEAAVIGRQLLYGGSALGDEVIAPDKVPLLVGQQSSFANYSSYDRGINGVVIDVEGFLQSPTLDDFTFRLGRTNDVSTWSDAPAPSGFTVTDVDASGRQRIVVRWDDGAIINQWLEVTLLASNSTGLIADDVFYFGSAPGDTGDSVTNALVNATDVVRTRDNKRGPFNPASLDNRYDFNRDGLVNATDVVFARDHSTSPFTMLPLIRPRVAAAAPTRQTPRAPLPAMADDDVSSVASWRKRLSLADSLVRRGTAARPVEVDSIMADVAENYATTMIRRLAQSIVRDK